MNKGIVVALIALGALARLAPHPWNFTPIMAIALYAGVKSTQWKGAALVTLLALLLSDVVLGFYSSMWVIYAASLIPVMLGRQIRDGGVKSLAAMALISSVSFFVLTNAATWAFGALYPHTLTGLSTCMAAGIPFFRNQLAGDVFFTAAIFGADALLQRRFHAFPQAA